MTINKAILAGFLLFLSNVRAQFYAPATEFHDPVQRMFVPEMARVLGWYENLEAPGIVEIKYEVTPKAGGATVWKVRWLEKDNKERFSAQIEYPESLLASGADFYRKVGADLMRADFKSRLRGVEKKNVIAGYWRGAGLMTFSREETLMRALNLASVVAEKEHEHLADLAGMLGQLSMFSVFERVTIDSPISARAAAWLYLAERSSADSLDALWAPVLYAAGRERKAAELWQKAYPAEIPKATLQEAGWNILLRQPTTLDVYLFAAKPENITMGVPMMAIDTIANGSGDLFIDSVVNFVDRKKLPTLHNYAPRLSDSGVGGGRIVEGYWPFFQRIAIIRLLDGYKPGPGDFENYAAELKTAKEALLAKRQFKDDEEGSVIGLKEFSGLIKLGFEEGSGSLGPTAVVTARDILNYTWESSCRQMARRIKFLDESLGLRQEGQDVYKEAIRWLPGSAPFFAPQSVAKTVNYKEVQERLQLFDGFYHHVGWSPNPFANSAAGNAADVFMKRSWGRPKELEWQIRSFFAEKQPRSIEQILTYYRDEGGPIAAAWAVSDLVEFQGKPTSIPHLEEFVSTFAARMTQPTPLYLRAKSKEYNALEPFKRAAAYEALYWKNPESGLESRVYRNYLLAGATNSARRFYGQARENFGDPIRVSNDIGMLAFIHGYTANDKELRDWAVKDSDSGSYSDFILQIWEAAIEDDRKKIASLTRDVVERYESDQGTGAMGKVLERFLPLLPALTNSRDPRHEAALNHFNGEQSWIILRWIWARKFKLAKLETIQFIGGRESDQFRHGLACYLDKDQPGMLDAINKHNSSEPKTDEKTILLYRLYDEIAPHKFVGEETDLKPKDAVSVRAILQKRAAQSK